MAGTADQPRLPGHCWTCGGCGQVTVAVTATPAGRDGYPECLAWRTACPDCRPMPGRRWAEAVRTMLADDPEQPGGGR